MKMWKKIVALMLGIMLMGTVAGAFAEEVVAAPVVEDVETVEATDVKTQILQHLTEKIQHMGDALMNMDFDIDIDLVMMGEAQQIKIQAEINAVSSGIEKVQLFGSASMKMGDESQETAIDGYLMKNEDETYTMYMRAEEGWTKQSVEIGDLMESLDQAAKTIDENGAFMIIDEPEEQEDGLHFQAYLDLAKILEATGEEGMSELNETTSELLPGMDVAQMLTSMDPVDIKIICDENYDPTAIFIDAKAAVQTLADVVIGGIVNQMLAAMVNESGETVEGAEEMDMSQFMKLTVNTLVWNFNKIQTLPANSVVIELPAEAQNAIEVQSEDMGTVSIGE